MRGFNRPIGHEERLSLVEHLEELRSRIIIGLVGFGIVFAVCFWQSESLLDFVNRPLDRATVAEVDRASADPLQQNLYYDRRIADALEQTGPGLERLGAALARLSTDESLGRAERLALRGPAAELRRAGRQLRQAAASVPEVTERRPVTLGVAEPMMTTLTVAGYAALLITLPLLLYQLYAYVLPALRPGERQVAVPLLLTVPALFLAGVAFAYVVVLPVAVEFLQGFNAESFDVLIQARAYYQFSIVMMAGVGLLFQIPVAILTLTRLGIVTSEQLRRNRPYYIFGASIAAAIGSVSPDPFTMIFLLVPLVLMFEIGVRLAAWMERRSERGEP